REQNSRKALYSGSAHRRSPAERIGIETAGFLTSGRPFGFAGGFDQIQAFALFGRGRPAVAATLTNDRRLAFQVPGGRCASQPRGRDRIVKKGERAARRAEAGGRDP